MKKIILSIMAVAVLAIAIYAEFGTRSVAVSATETDPIYISSAPLTYVNKSGDTMSGTLSVPSIISGGKTLSNFPAIGEVLTTRVPIWHGGETTTTSTSYTPKTFKALMYC